jgi:uncharacterized protein YbjT (DUF2867 family)
VLYVIAGANGQTGSVVANTLLDQGKPVRVILRRAEQGPAWLARGAEVCIADLADEAALVDAFSGAKAAYLMNPPAYQAHDLMAPAKRVHQAMISAAERAGVRRVVALSSVGAQHATGTGNILTTHDFESRLATSQLHVGVLRAANFIENWAWFLDGAVANGKLPSMFQPLGVALPMVSVSDIGRTAAEMLDQSSTGIVELHGPEAYSPNDAATQIGRIAGRTVNAIAVPRNDWHTNFHTAGYSASAIKAFCDMFDGFNTGRVAFEGTHQTRHGSVSQEEVFRHLLAAKGAPLGS